MRRQLMEGMQRWLAWLAKPELTVFFFVVTALAALGVAHELFAATALMAFPFALLGINLAAAIAIHARFRGDTPLLGFHLALLAMVMLFVFGRLSYFDGTFVLTRNIPFDGRFEKAESGPLHGDAYRRLQLVNEGFIELASNDSLRYTGLSNLIEWNDGAGRQQSARIYDDVPLVIGGYRIYPLAKRGYSPLIAWTPVGAATIRAAIPIPAGPMSDFQRGVSWNLGPGLESWASILEDNPSQPAAPGPRENLGVATLPHHLVIWIGDMRHLLRPGESLTLPQGTLTYLELDAWLGYRVVYDPTKPWLIACVLLAMSCLIWFYLRRFKLGERVTVSSP